MKFFSTCLFAMTFFLNISGCASLGVPDQFVAKPKLEVASFTMNEASFLQQNFKVKLKVDNPNAFALPILGLNYGLNIAGVDVAKGSNDTQLTIPAGGSDYLDINVNTNLLKTLPDLKRVLMSGGKDMSYTIAGNVKTNNSIVRSIPFQKTGLFELKF